MPKFSLSVWSNIAYLAAPVASYVHGVGPIAQTVLTVTAVVLVLASGAYHLLDTRLAQRIDVAATLTFLVGLFAVTLSAWTVWVYVLVPVAAVYYSARTWAIDSEVHFPIWAALTIIALAVQVGAASLIPGALLGAGALAAHVQSGPHGVSHALWHLLTAAAAAALVLLI